MATYRAYFLDSESHITDRRDIEANEASEAVNTARQWIDGKTIEVWCGPVLVEAIKPKQKRWI
jgi:hypothetical protein